MPPQAILTATKFTVCRAGIFRRQWVSSYYYAWGYGVYYQPEFYGGATVYVVVNP